MGQIGSIYFKDDEEEKKKKTPSQIASEQNTADRGQIGTVGYSSTYKPVYPQEPQVALQQPVQETQPVEQESKLKTSVDKTFKVIGEVFKAVGKGELNKAATINSATQKSIKKKDDLLASPYDKSALEQREYQAIKFGALKSSSKVETQAEVLKRKQDNPIEYLINRPYAQTDEGYLRGDVDKTPMEVMNERLKTASEFYNSLSAEDKVRIKAPDYVDEETYYNVSIYADDTISKLSNEIELINKELEIGGSKKDIRQLENRKEELEEYVAGLKDIKQGIYTQRKAIDGAIDFFTSKESIPFIGAILSAEESITLLRAYKKLEKGEELNEREKMLIERDDIGDTIDYLTNEYTLGSEIAKGTLGSVALMAEFILAGWLFDTVGLGVVASKTSKGITLGTAQGASKVAQFAGGTLRTVAQASQVTVTAGMGRIIGEATERQTPIYQYYWETGERVKTKEGEDPATAWTKAVALEFGNNLVEVGLGGFTDPAKISSNLMKQGALGSFPEEFTEEIVQKIWEEAGINNKRFVLPMNYTDSENEFTFTPRELVTIGATTLLLGTLSSALDSGQITEQQAQQIIDEQVQSKLQEIYDEASGRTQEELKEQLEKEKNENPVDGTDYDGVIEEVGTGQSDRFDELEADIAKAEQEIGQEPQEEGGLVWEYGAEDMAAVPNEPIAFLLDNKNQDLANAKATISFDVDDETQAELGYKITLKDGTIVSNPESTEIGGSPYFKTRQEAEVYAEEFISKQVETKQPKAKETPVKLEEEAKKYKSAEEFVKAQGKEDDYLYHATYQPVLNNIKKEGLNFSGSKNYSDSVSGKIYFDKTPYGAEAFAETSETVPEEWLSQIVVLKIPKSSIDTTSLSVDKNVLSTKGVSPQSFEYTKIVSPENISEYKTKAQLEDIWNKAQPKTQKEKVKEVLEKESKPMSIKEVADATKILEPNIRRILGVGAKTGEFTRVADGVYVLKTESGQVAYIQAGNALEELPKLAKDGFKADMVFLDIPYKTPAITGGNRGMKYDFVTPAQFGDVLDSVNTILRKDTSPVIYMYSQAESGLAEMQKYNDMLDKKGLKVIAKGEWQKTYKDGKPVAMFGRVAKPEGILLLSQSGRAVKDILEVDLKFDFVRPKGYQSEKNADMIRDMIELTTETGDVVLDPFAGSGVVPAEAIKSGRSAVAIEVDKKVVEETIKPRVEKASKEVKVKPKAKTAKKTEMKDEVVEWLALTTAELDSYKSRWSDVMKEKYTGYLQERGQQASLYFFDKYITPKLSEKITSDDKLFDKVFVLNWTGSGYESDVVKMLGDFHEKKKPTGTQLVKLRKEVRERIRVFTESANEEYANEEPVVVEYGSKEEMLDAKAQYVYAKDFDDITSNQQVNILSSLGDDGESYIKTTDEEVLKKLGRGIGIMSAKDFDEVKGNILLFKGLEEKLYTDGMILITDSKVASQLNRKFIETTVKASAKSWGVSEVEANKKIKEDIKDKDFPATKEILDRAKMNIELKEVGFFIPTYIKAGGAIILRTKKGTHISLNGKYYSAIKSFYPSAKFYIAEESSTIPISFAVNGKRKGLVMPMMLSSDASFKNLIKEKGVESKKEEEFVEVEKDKWAVKREKVVKEEVANWNGSVSEKDVADWFKTTEKDWENHELEWEIYGSNMTEAGQNMSKYFFNKYIVPRLSEQLKSDTKLFEEAFREWTFSYDEGVINDYDDIRYNPKATEELLAKTIEHTANLADNFLKTMTYENLKGLMSETKIDKSKEVTDKDFVVGEQFDTQGNSNMKGIVTLSSIGARSVVFTDQEGTEYAKFDKATFRTLLKEGKWKEFNPLAEDDLPFRKEGRKRLNSDKLNNMQLKEMKKLSREVFGDEKVEIMEQVLTPDTLNWMGRYVNDMIQIRSGSIDKGSTFYHEIVHKAFDKFLTPSEQEATIKEARRTVGDDYLIEQLEKQTEKERRRIGKYRESDWADTIIRQYEDIAQASGIGVEGMIKADKALRGKEEQLDNLADAVNTESDLISGIVLKEIVNGKTSYHLLKGSDVSVMYALVKDKQLIGDNSQNFELIKMSDLVNHPQFYSLDIAKIPYNPNTFPYSEDASLRGRQKRFRETYEKNIRDIAVKDAKEFNKEMTKYRGVYTDMDINGMAQEWLAENVLDHINTKTPTTFIGKLKRMVEQFIDRWFRTMDNIDSIENFYEGLLSGRLLARQRKLDSQRAKTFDKYLKSIQGAGTKTDAMYRMEVAKEVQKLTTKILKRLEGKTGTVKKQYISDLTKQQDIKQVEKDIINDVLKTFPDDIDVATFEEKVLAQLLPLERIETGREYDNYTLPEYELAGDVYSYEDVVYVSPIKTRAGATHFSHLKTGNGQEYLKEKYKDSEKAYTNYFGHNRVQIVNTESGGKDGLILENQVDLYQKGKLELESAEIKYPLLRGYDSRYGVPTKEDIEAEIKETEQYLDGMNESNSEYGYYTNRLNLLKKDLETVGQLKLLKEERRREIEPLYQYKDPTAHLRILREEIAHLSNPDLGIDNILVPRGETALMIEKHIGAGKAIVDPMGGGFFERLTVDNLEEGLVVGDISADVYEQGLDMYVVKVLGDGKYLAVDYSEDVLLNNENIYQLLKDSGYINENEDYIGTEEMVDIFGDPDIKKLLISEKLTEQLDINDKGEINTESPIYIHYEATLGKYLKNNYEATEHVDQYGHGWWKVKTKQEYAGAVEAFRLDELVDYGKVAEGVRNIRWMFPKVRDGWTKDKILKQLKKWASEYSPTGKTMKKEIKMFNSPEELAENIYYHGSANSIGKLKPSIAFSEKWVEQYGGGGYGQQYWGISLSKDRHIASNFTGGQARWGNVAMVLLKKGAKVEVMPNIEDAVEIEDIIEDLWNRGVDAVKIGDWENKEYGERELVVLNPKAIVVGQSESFPVYQKPKMPSFDMEKITKMYNDALSEGTDTVKYRLEDEEVSVKLPELVTLAENLGANVKLQASFRKAGVGGDFQPQGGTDSRIRILRTLFDPQGEVMINAVTGEEERVPETPEQQMDRIKSVEKVLGHEIGHLFDWFGGVDNMTLKRGNILGRIGNFRSFLGGILLSPEQQSEYSEAKTYAKDLQYERKQVKGVDKNKYEDLGKQLKITNRRIKELEEDALAKHPEVRKELKTMTQLWNPFEESEAPAEYLKYRYSSKELYAEALSVLFNDPRLLKQTAPTFYQSFVEYLASKKEVKAEFFAIKDSIKESTYIEKRIDKMEEGFEKGRGARMTAVERKEVGKKQREWQNVMSRVKYSIADQHAPYLDKVRKIYKEGGIELSRLQESEMLMDEMEFIGDKQGIYAKDIQTNFFDPISEAGISVDDLGKIMVLERDLGDRKDLANPQGLVYDYAKETYDELKAKFSPAEWVVLQDRINWFREYNFNLVQEGYKAGVYSKQFFEEIATVNKNTYTPFAVIEYINDNYVTAGIIQAKGTLKQVENPINTQMLKSLELIRLTTTNSAKTDIIKTLQEFAPEEIVQAQAVRGEDGYVKMFKRDPELADKGYEQLELLIDGKRTAFYVDGYIKESFDKLLDMSTSQAVKMFFAPVRAFNRIFKPAVTTFKPSFQFYSNPIKDIKDSLNNLSALSAYFDQDNRGVALRTGRVYKAFMKEWMASLKQSWDYAGNKMDKVTEQMLRVHAISGNIKYEDIDLGTDEISFDAVKNRVVHKGKVNWADSAIEWMGSKAILKQTIYPLLKVYQRLGQTLEVNSKVAGFQYFTKEIGLDEKTAGYYTRKYVGTPNFMQKGKFTNITNEIQPFSNVAMQGFSRSIELAGSPKTASGYWFSMFFSTIVPKLVMLAGATLLKVPIPDPDDEDKTIWVNPFDYMSEYDKSNYITIPIGYDITTKKFLYLRIPMSETEQVVGNAVWKMGRVLQGEGIKVEQLAVSVIGMIPFAGLVFGDGNPFTEIVGGWADYVQGRNPYDDFRGRPAIATSKWDQAGAVRFSEMLKWTSNTIGLSNFTTYDKDLDTTFEHVLQAPILERMFRLSDYGLTEREEWEKDMGKRSKNKTLDGYLEKYYSEPSDKNLLKYQEEYVIAVKGARPKDGWKGEEKAEETRLKTEFKREILANSGNGLYTSIAKTGLDNDEKVKIIDAKTRSMSDGQKADYLSQVVKYEIVKGEMFAQYAKDKGLSSEMVYKVVKASIPVLSADSNNDLLRELRQAGVLSDRSLTQLRNDGLITTMGYKKYLGIKGEEQEERQTGRIKRPERQYF